MEDPGICQIFFFPTTKYGELDTDSVIHQGNASRSQKGKKQILNKQHDLLHRFLLFVRSKARLPVQTRAVSDVSEYSIMTKCNEDSWATEGQAVSFARHGIRKTIINVHSIRVTDTVNARRSY